MSVLMLSSFEPFQIEHFGAVCIVHAVGDVDFSNSAVLEGAMEEASFASGGPLIASFADCTFADCSCLNVLVRTYKTLGERLHIVAPPKGSLRRVLDLTKMSGALPIRDELSSALFAASVWKGRPAIRGQSAVRMNVSHHQTPHAPASDE
jgi:anti-anti-sigma factor